MPAIVITYQQRGYCSKAGYAKLRAVLDDCRRLYNAALQERRDAYRMAGKTVSWVDQNRSLTDIRADWPTREGAVDRRVQRGVLRRLDRAYQAFFRRVKAGETPGFPRFKGAARYRTIDVEAPTAAMLKVSADGRKAWVKVKGLPTVEMRTKRQLPAPDAIKSLRLVWRPTGVWVDMAFEVEREPLPPATLPIGIDSGVTDRLALSNGELIEGKKSGFAKPRRGRSVAPCSSERENRLHGPPSTAAIPGIGAEGAAPCSADAPSYHQYRAVRGRAAPCSADAPRPFFDIPPILEAAPCSAAEAQTALQQRISRCKKGSRRQRKLYGQLARLRFRQRVANRNECHRITTDIVRRFGRIAVEKLDIRNMTRSASGTEEEPGKNVAAKSGLNREILAQTWGLIREQLRYKAAWAGREFAEVDPRHTSQICSRCGLKGERDSKMFTCGNCGLHYDADLNAAANILRRAFGPTGGYVRRNRAGNSPGQVALLPG